MGAIRLPLRKVWPCWKARPRWQRSWLVRSQLTTFEQVLLGNSLVIIASTLLTFGVTRLTLEPYHFLLDTLTVLLAILCGVGINAILLRRAFAPLFAMLQTIQAVQHGDQTQRVAPQETASDITKLASAFNAMLDGMQVVQQQALRDVAQAQEAERRRIALELHDATGQDLTALLLKLTLAEQDLEDETTDPALIRRQLNGAIALVQTTMSGVRSLAQQLRPSVLDDLGLVAALHWLGQQVNGQGGLRVEVEVAGWPEGLAPGGTRLPALTETMLFRLAQEALTNVLRHSQARTATVSLRRDGTTAVLQIQDDGCGFNRAEAIPGMGLRGMQDRMILVHGTCDIASQPATGTTIRATVPLMVPAQGGKR